MNWIIFITLLAGVSFGTLVGLMICANTTLGDFSFVEPGKDIARCIVLGVIVAACGAGLMSLTRDPRVVLGLLPVWYITAKLCWLELERVEMAIIGGSSLVSMFVAVVIATAILQ
jgi:hypothetical protein